MKIKTSDLTGNALCYAVCTIELPHLVWGDSIGMHHASNQVVVPSMRSPDCYSPYMNWAMCGPIIEREGFTLWATNAAGWRCQGRYNYVKDCEGPTTEGPTPLIAAMRCYCRSKLGEYVDIPEELCQQQSS